MNNEIRQPAFPHDVLKPSICFGGTLHPIVGGDMGKVILLITVLGLMVWGTGCAGPTFNKFDVSTGESLSIDATQRIILVKQLYRPLPHMVVCAEPSPDAMTATSAALATSGGYGPFDWGVKGSIIQDVTNIGFRTATIQLLRDGLYRACEAYMNEILDKSDYRLIVQNFDRLMVALLAIDATKEINSTPGNQTIQGKSSHNTSSAPVTSPQRHSSDSSVQNKGSTIQSMQNGDQVIETVAQYMLDNNKWAFASCLNYMQGLSKPDDKSKKLPQNPYAAAAQKDSFAVCHALLWKYINIKGNGKPVRLFQSPFGNKVNR